MNCLKCGKEAEGNNVFCDQCLQDAKSYPIKPGTVVQLHPRDAAAERKAAPRFHGPTPAEQIQQLRRKNRRLSWIIAALVLLLGVAAAALLQSHFPG